MDILDRFVENKYDGDYAYWMVQQYVIDYKDLRIMMKKNSSQRVMDIANYFIVPTR